MATPTITSDSPRHGGPRTLTGYFTADATTTQETLDLSDYGGKVKFAVSWAEDDVSASPIYIKGTSFSTTGYTVTIDHTSPTTTSATIKFIVDIQ